MRDKWKKPIKSRGRRRTISYAQHLSRKTPHLSTAAPPRQQAGFSAESAETNDRKYSSSPERLKAVKEYTDTFGGSMEENMAALRGLSIEEIRDAIDKGLPY